MTVTERTNRVRRAVLQVVFALLYRYGGRIYAPLTRLLFGSAWQEWREALAASIESGPVLDLGCGTGELLEALARQQLWSVGVDREASMLRPARARSVMVVRADAGRLPFAGATFACCVASFPAPFVLEESTQREIARVVQPGGRVAILIGGQATSRRPGALLERVLRPRPVIAAPLPPLLGHPFVLGSCHHVQTRSGTAYVWRARLPDKT